MQNELRSQDEHFECNEAPTDANSVKNSDYIAFPQQKLAGADCANYRNTELLTEQFEPGFDLSDEFPSFSPSVIHNFIMDENVEEFVCGIPDCHCSTSYTDSDDETPIIPEIEYGAGKSTKESIADWLYDNEDYFLEIDDGLKLKTARRDLKSICWDHLNQIFNAEYRYLALINEAEKVKVINKCKFVLKWLALSKSASAEQLRSIKDDFNETCDVIMEKFMSNLFKFIDKNNNAS